MTGGTIHESDYDELFEHGIRQVAEQAKLAMEGLSALLTGLISFLEMPESKEYFSDEVKQALESMNIQELKEKAAKLSIASEALDYLQTEEAMTILSVIQGRQDLLRAYTQMAMGIYKLQNFLEGKSAL